MEELGFIYKVSASRTQNTPNGMNWRPETFAWYFLLKFTTFLLTETRYGENIEGTDEGCRTLESHSAAAK